MIHKCGVAGCPGHDGQNEACYSPESDAALAEWHQQRFLAANKPKGAERAREVIPSNLRLAETLRTLARGYSTENGRNSLLVAASIVERANHCAHGCSPGREPCLCCASVGQECCFSHERDSQPRHGASKQMSVIATLRDLRHVAEASGRPVTVTADNTSDILAEIDGRDETLRRIDELLQQMIVGAQVYVDEEQTITAYKIRTGALHKLAGLRTALFFPQNLPLAASPETKAPRDAEHCDYPDCEQHWSCVAQSLRDALEISRGQWIHSVNAPQCLAALAMTADLGPSAVQASEAKS